MKILVVTCVHIEVHRILNQLNGYVYGMSYLMYYMDSRYARTSYLDSLWIFLWESKIYTTRGALCTENSIVQ